MGELVLNGSSLGSQLMSVLEMDDLEPGDDISYQACKTLYEYHPLGPKLAEAPIRLAQSQPRDITVIKGPEDRVRDQFQKEWEKLECDKLIFNTVKLSRIYGIASIVMLVDGEDPSGPVDYPSLWEKEVSFNVFDPLNTAGSLVFNQNPNAVDFQKSLGSVSVQGVTYHKKRTCIQLNEEPIYLGWTTSAWGYVGRSVYQRSLFMMKSFVQTMITDDLVSKKAGLIVAMLKQAGSIVNAMMQTMAGIKRSILKGAVTNNVISIDVEEKVESLDLTNVNTAMSESRKNILNNMAAAAGMPAILVNEETFAEGFGEGTEDAKHVALYIEDYRKTLKRIYEFFDQIVMYRAWNKEFFERMQNEYPDDYANKTYAVAFSDWKNSFSAKWPSLLTEPESELAKKDDIRLKAIIALLEVLLPEADPDNKGTIIEWAQDNFNALETLFSAPLMLDIEAIAAYTPPMPAGPGGNPDETEPKPPKPMRSDSVEVKRVKARIERHIRLLGAGAKVDA